MNDASYSLFLDLLNVYSIRNNFQQVVTKHYFGCSCGVTIIKSEVSWLFLSLSLNKSIQGFIWQQRRYFIEGINQARICVMWQRCLCEWIPLFLLPCIICSKSLLIQCYRRIHWIECARRLGAVDVGWLAARSCACRAFRVDSTCCSATLCSSVGRSCSLR